VVAGPRFSGAVHDCRAHTTRFAGVISIAWMVPNIFSGELLHSFAQLFTTVSPFGSRQAC
jgi:hypothetical protein